MVRSVWFPCHLSPKRLAEDDDYYLSQGVGSGWVGFRRDRDAITSGYSRAIMRDVTVFREFEAAGLEAHLSALGPEVLFLIESYNQPA